MEDDRWRDFSKWDEKMMQEFIRENAAAFRVFVSRYAKREEDIDDILQDAYLKLWQNRMRIGEVASPRNYFYTMLKHVADDFYSSSWHRRTVSLEEVPADVPDEGALERHVMEAETSRLIAEALAKLSPQARRVMEMTLEERPLQEIAKELGVTVNTVKTVKYRALNRLSELLTPEDFATVVMMCCAPYLW